MDIWKLLLVGFLLASCAQQEGPYLFGAVLPLSGPAAFHGEYSRIGIDLAVEDINAAGGINGRPLEAIYEDSGSEKKGAATAAQKLVTVDGVDALFTITTPFAGAVAPIAEAHRTPLIYQSATNAFAEGTTYVFKDYPDARDLCRALMAQAMDDGHETVALFGTNAEFTHLCREGAEEAGGISYFEIYAPGESDYRSHLVKMRDAGAMIISLFAADCPNLYRQMKELGLSPQLYISFNSFGCGSDANTAEGGELLLGAYGADVAVDEESSDPAFLALKGRIEEQQTTSLRGSVMLYDLTMEMARAYEGCADAECAVGRLRNLSYDGVAGLAEYGGGQIVKREIMLVRYEHGGWVKTS